MSDSNICPHCGGDRLTRQSADRVCGLCGNTFPAIPGDQRRGRRAALWLVFTITCLVIACASVLLIVEGGDRNGAAAVGTALLFLSITAAVFGFYFSLRALLVAPVVFLPGKPGRLLPADRAAAVIREVALLHRAAHILKQLDGIRPSRIARARARFARSMTDDETPLILVDASFLRDGRAGFLLTNRAVYSDRLPAPIALAEVAAVRHRPPDGHMSSLEVAFAAVHVLFPPAALLLLPLAFRRRKRMRHELAINDRLVYAGQKNLAWAFWMDVLPALAAELAVPGEPGRMTILETVHQGAEGVVVANPRMREPGWEKIESAIRALDGWANPAIFLWTGTAERPVGLEIRGRAGGYALRELPAGWVYHDPGAGDDEVEVSVGQLGHRCPASEVCTDVGRVLRIGRGFVATGGFE